MQPMCMLSVYVLGAVDGKMALTLILKLVTLMLFDDVDVV